MALSYNQIALLLEQEGLGMRVFVFVLTAVVLLGALWWGFKPQHNEQQVPQSASVGVIQPPAQTSQHQADPVAQTHTVQVVVRAGKASTTPAVLKAMAGDTIVFEVTSDRQDAMHIHGYDVMTPIVAGQPASVTINAKLTGRFEYELEKSHQELGVIEVYPR